MDPPIDEATGRGPTGKRSVGPAQGYGHLRAVLSSSHPKGKAPIPPTVLRRTGGEMRSNRSRASAASVHPPAV